MVIPVILRAARTAPNLNKPDASFSKPSGQEAIARKSTISTGAGCAIAFMNKSSLTGKVEHLGSCKLHLCGKFITFNACLKSRIAQPICCKVLIHIIKQFQSIHTCCGGDKFTAGWGLQIWNRSRGCRVDRRTLMRNRKEA